MPTEKKKIFWLILIRLIVFTSLLISVVILQFSTPEFLPVAPFTYLIFFTYFLSLVYVFLYALSRRYSRQAHIQILVDLLLITALVYISGGLSGSFYFLYLFSIIAASIVISGRSAYLMAALSAIFFGLMVEGLYFGIIPYFSPEHYTEMSPGLALFTIIVAWIVFFLVAFLSNHLAGNLTRTTQELRLAQKELEIKERLVAAGRMAAQLAHEVRNPLAAISGSVQMLKDVPMLSEEQKRLMGIVVKESDRVSQSIEQFLDLASPGKIVFYFFDLAETFREVLVMMRASGELSDGVRLQGNYAEARVQFFGNANQFKQIFWNLTRNALRAMPGGGTMTVDLFQERKKEVGFRVADTGKGLSSEEKEHFFEPFFPGADAGKGIGMTVVRRIVDDYEGRIQVISEPGKGTELTITLPIKETRGKTAYGLNP